MFNSICLNFPPNDPLKTFSAMAFFLVNLFLKFKIFKDFFVLVCFFETGSFL